MKSSEFEFSNEIIRDLYPGKCSFVSKYIYIYTTQNLGILIIVVEFIVSVRTISCGNK